MKSRASWGVVLALSGLLIAGCERPQISDNEIPVPQEQQSPLVGKPAPEIQSTFLDGSAFSLKEETGKSVVMLDFWATWCGPCVMELPILVKLAEEFKDKGVALYAVNAGEDSETIQDFMKENAFDFKVVMDPEGKHATAYQVDGIPQLVIVGRDGVIRQLHVGFSPDLERQLRSELTSILESK